MVDETTSLWHNNSSDVRPHEGSAGTTRLVCLPGVEQARQEAIFPDLPLLIRQEGMPIALEKQEQQEGRLLLTETNLAQHAPEFDLKPSKSSVGSSSSLSDGQMTKDKRIPSSDPGFDLIARLNGLRTDQSRTQAPDNLATLQAALTRDRDEQPPSETKFQEYVLDVIDSSNEAELSHILTRYLWKFYENPYTTKFDCRFDLFPQDVGFNNDAAPPQPDIMQGFKEEAFDLGLLGSTEGVVPHSRSNGSVALPHLAGELKYCRGDMIQARLQSCYDAAALLWARHNALVLIGRPDLDDGQARVFTFNYNGTYLEVFACLRVEIDNGRVEYHQHLLKSVFLTTEYDDFKAGWTVLRNLQDLAKKESTGLRDLLSQNKARPRASTVAPSSNHIRTDNGGEERKRRRQASSPPRQDNLGARVD